MKAFLVGGLIGVAILALLGVPVWELAAVIAWYAGIIAFGWVLYALGERWKRQQTPPKTADDSISTYWDPGVAESSSSETYIAVSSLQQQLEEDGVVDLPSLGIRITKLDPT